MSFVPERLKDVRIRNGHTTEALAKQCGVSKQVISKYETGQAIPSEDVLQKIVAYYGLSRRYVTKENILPKERSDVFYRKTARMPKRELDSVQVSMKWLYEIIAAVKESQPLPSVFLPSVENDFSIEKKALILRQKWGLGLAPIADLADVLEKQGVHLFTTHLEDIKIDGYSQLIGKEAIIVLNQDRGSLARKNFSLAHEMGHLMLHTNEEFDGSLQKEEQADDFAGCFLMPETAFRRDVQEMIRINVESLKELSEKWYVSPQAVLERCFKLDMLGKNLEESKARRQALFQRLNQREYFELQTVRMCSIENALRKIDADEQMRKNFLESVCIPVYEIQKLCQLPNIFEKGLVETESVDDIDGVQLSFV